MGKRGSVDGLINMWAHAFDRQGNVVMQFQILHRTGDGYLCQTYSMEDGELDVLKVVARKDIIRDMRLYYSHYEMNDALDKIEEANWRRRQAMTPSQISAEMH